MPTIEGCGVFGGRRRANLLWRNDSSLKLQLSKMASLRTWNQVVRSLFHEPNWISAHRGGGSARHTVWKLDFDAIDATRNRLLLFVAEHHLSESHEKPVQQLIQRFFSAVAGHANLTGGWGELLDTGWPCTFVQEPSVVSFDRQMFNELHDEAVAAGLPLIPWPRWITALNKQQVKRIGGAKQLKASWVKFRRRRDIAVALSNPREMWQLDPIIHESPDCTIVMLCDVVRGLHCGQYSFSAGPDENKHWFISELNRAGMIAASSLGRVDRILRGMREKSSKRASLPAASRDAPPRTRFAGLMDKLNVTPPSSAPGATPAGREAPQFLRVCANTTRFRVNQIGLLHAMPIYGRKTGYGLPDHVLSSPVLVGSLNPRRAALYFDERLHGWDGVQVQSGAKREHRLGRLMQLVCPDCQGRLFHAWASFEYPDDLPEFDEPPFRDHPEDLFSWFWLAATCASCKWSGLVADIECA